MPVKGVYLTADCYSVCLSHALTTEKEEIMGLLIGEACLLILQSTLQCTSVIFVLFKLQGCGYMSDPRHI